MGGRRRRHHLRQVRRWCCCFSFLGLLGRQSRGTYDLNNQQQHLFFTQKEQLLACVKKGKCCCWEEVAGRYERERIQEGVLVCVWIDRGSAFFWRVLALFVGWLLCFQRQQQQQKKCKIRTAEDGGGGRERELPAFGFWNCLGVPTQKYLGRKVDSERCKWRRWAA